MMASNTILSGNVVDKYGCLYNNDGYGCDQESIIHMFKTYVTYRYVDFL